MAIHYPQAWCLIHLLLDDLGQEPEPDLITIQGAPVSFRVEKNRWSEADTFELTFDSEDYPFDPGVIRGGTVEIYLADAGSVDPGFFTRGATVGGLSVDEARERALIFGVVDDAESSFGEEGRMFTLKGRDYTAYFLDAEVEEGEILYQEGGRKLTFVEMIRRLVASRKTTEEIEVVTEGPVPPFQPADYKEDAEERRVGPGETAWELVQELALEAGFAVYVDRDQIVVRPPSDIYNHLEPHNLRRALRFELGTDVLEWKPTRELGRRHGVAVQVTSYFTAEDRPLQAFARDGELFDPKDPPPEADTKELTAKKGGGNPSKTKKSISVVRFAMRHVNSQTQLEVIARELSLELQHHEMVGTLTTHAMTDRTGRLVSDIRFGDPVFVDRSPGLQSALLRTTQDQVEELAKIGWERPDAEALREALARLDLPLYVDTATYTFDTRDGQGFSLELTLRRRRQVSAPII